ncbi:MAG: DUF2865 domain-containing protein [Pseudomonadota bacterium]
MNEQVVGKTMTPGRTHRRGLVNSLVVALCATAWMSFDVTPAKAQSNSNLCLGLRAQLASLNRSGGGDSRQYRKYDNAIRKQQLQIGKAKRAARRNGCTGLFKNRNNQCRRINDSMRKMQVNLESLKRTRARLSPSQGGNSRKRRQILRQLEVNGCNGGSGAVYASNQPEKKSRRRTLLEQVFGVKTYSDRGTGRYGEDVEADSRFTLQYGTYRTLCVRKSDGYYFPISFSTVPERFDHDEELCQNMCPSSDVGLYVHRMPSQDSEDMISYRTEVAYADEPFAFAYRKSHNPDNKCRFSVAGLSQSVDAAPTGEVEKPEKETIRIGIPNFRTDPSETPDAYDNKTARLSLDQLKSYLVEANQPKTEIGERTFTGGKQIRIVGPAFFPVQ